MNKKTILIIAIVLTSMLFVSGCTQQQSAIKTSEEVSQVVTNVSSDVQGVSNTLADIDNTLGGK